MSSVLGSALGQVGQTVADAPANLAQQSGLANLAQGVTGLFGGDQATVPADFVGPPSPFESPNFLQGFVQGFTGAANPLAGADAPGAGGQTGAGLGQLLHALEQIRQQRGGTLGGVTPIAGGDLGAVEMLPGYQTAQIPTSGLVHRLIGAATYGILNTNTVPSR